MVQQLFQRTCTNESDAIADGDAGQAGMKERTCTNGSDAIADGDADQFGNPFERTFPNGSDAIHFIRIYINIRPCKIFQNTVYKYASLIKHESIDFIISGISTHTGRRLFHDRWLSS